MIARKRGKTCITAEGIEHSERRDTLLKQGCEQGGSSYSAAPFQLMRRRAFSVTPIRKVDTW